MHGVDIIGTLYEPIVQPVGWNGAPPPPPPEHVAVSGWHVNVTADGLADRLDLEPFVVAPATLQRVWAGDDPANPTLTVALRFADEAEGAPFFAD